MTTEINVYDYTPLLSSDTENIINVNEVMQKYAIEAKKYPVLNTNMSSKILSINWNYTYIAGGALAVCIVGCYLWYKQP